MASLLIAGGIWASNRIRDKKAEKREKKRQAYAARYDELQREHSHHEEQYLQRRKTGESQTAKDAASVPTTATRQDAPRRRNSNSSEKSRHSRSSMDGPAQWVETARSGQI